MTKKPSPEKPSFTKQISTTVEIEQVLEAPFSGSVSVKVNRKQGHSAETSSVELTVNDGIENSATIYMTGRHALQIVTAILDAMGARSEISAAPPVA